MAAMVTGHPCAMAVDVDLFGREIEEDPYPWYDALRSGSPVAWSARHRSWVVTRYADVRALLRDDRLTHWSTGGGVLERWLRLMEPASGSRMRAAVGRALGHDTIADLQHELPALASALLRTARNDGGMDAVAGYAEPIALAVLCRLFGIPADRREECAGLARGYAGSVFVPGNGREATPLSAFIRDLASLRRSSPGGTDVLTALESARRQGDPIDEDDISAFAAFFMFAAFENARNFIGNAVLALARHPDQFARLAREPGLVATAVEELLRFDSPVQFMMMTTPARLELGGAAVRAGSSLLLGIGAANRDPARFDEPGRLDVGRSDCAHLTFGTGPLTCIGAALARVQGQVAIGALSSHCAGIALAGAPLRRCSLPVLRGLQALPLAVAS